MRVEDIEIYHRRIFWIKEAYAATDGDIDNKRLQQNISRISHRSQAEKPKTFDELSLGEYVSLLTLHRRLGFFRNDLQFA